MSDAERRSFFRINNELTLSYKPVDVHTVEHNKAEDHFQEDGQSVHVFDEMERLNHEASGLLAGLGESNRQLADYLTIQSKKIDLLANLLSTQNQSGDVKPTHVNLSEGGLAFKTTKPLYKGSYLAIRMMFMGSFSVVICYARVIRCDEKSPDEYQVAVKFLKLTEIQQQALSKNILKAQMRERKRKIQN
ncbi:MAG: PilZ domain-containing protein [Candidatus Pelagadaptatus aseana]|uniref:PilZ domain-containing protein n=1 Tax=Candidatus Pelagadaptatus aseana TaxID=3120508 RepID=UPI0039B1484C